MASKSAALHPWDKQMVFAQERKASTIIKPEQQQQISCCFYETEEAEEERESCCGGWGVGITTNKQTSQQLNEKHTI